MARCENCIHYDICTFHITGNESEKCLAFQHEYNKLIAEAKQEVAREIFEEIDALFVRFYDDPSYSSGELGYDIAELKKKYTGGEV